MKCLFLFSSLLFITFSVITAQGEKYVLLQANFNKSTTRSDSLIGYVAELGWQTSSKKVESLFCKLGVQVSTRGYADKIRKYKYNYVGLPVGLGLNLGKQTSKCSVHLTFTPSLLVKHSSFSRGQEYSVLWVDDDFRQTPIGVDKDLAFLKMFVGLGFDFHIFSIENRGDFKLTIAGDVTSFPVKTKDSGLLYSFGLGIKWFPSKWFPIKT